MALSDQSFLGMARNVACNSNCIRRAVGSIIVRQREVISTGWNGVSVVYKDCHEAGCPRCINGGVTGSGYERCICIHAEQRAIADAAFRGVSTEKCVLYVNLRPCFQCLALVRAAGVRGVVFDEDWVYPKEFEQAYRALADEFDFFRRVSGPKTVGPNPSRALATP